MSAQASSGAGRGGQIRASDEDREALIAELNEHTVAGRLSTEEFEQRTQAAYSAQTLGELDALRGDLPITRRTVALSHAARRAHLTRRLLQEAGGTAGVFVLCTAIWLISGASGQFWPVWILIVLVLILVRNGWSLFGPAPDLDAVERDLNARRRRRVDRDQRRSDRSARRMDRGERRSGSRPEGDGS